jgi:hypothetical protein
MAKSESLDVALGLASGLASAETESEAAAAIARAAGQLTGAESARVWILDRHRGYRFAGTWPEDSDRPEEPSAIVARVVAFGTADCSEAEPPFRSRLTLPLLAGLRPLGAIVLLEQGRPQGPFTDAEAERLSALVQVADIGLQSVRDRSVREAGRIEAINRLTRLFDIARMLAATPEMEDLVTLVVNRVQNAFDVEAAYLWLLDEETGELSMAAAMAPDPDAVLNWKLEVGSGAAGQAAESGEAVRYDDPEDIPDLEARPDNQGELRVWCEKPPSRRRSRSTTPVGSTRSVEPAI